MKARTKLQLRVTELSNQLPRISKSQEQWAYKECLPHLGYANKSSAFCLDCGETFSLDLIKRKRAVCPHCATKLTIEQTKKRTYSHVTYFGITHVVEEFQVVESFELWAHYKKGEPVRYMLHAILEDWIQPNLKVTKIGLLHMCNWMCDAWNGNWEIRAERHSWYRNENRYSVYPRMYHPDSEFKPEYLKIGINHNLRCLNVLDALKLIPQSSMAETLIKAKEYELLDFMESHFSETVRYWPSIKIALRNKYKIKDVKIWFDYLYLLSYLKKDLNNSVYVCPKDLKKAHDLYMNRKRKITERIQMEHDYVSILKRLGEYNDIGFSFPSNLRSAFHELQQREKLLLLEKRKKELEKIDKVYREFIKPFLGVEFCNNLIQIVPLKSIEEFITEGDTLKHCVYTNEYFKKKNCLILSARIDGKPIETIELNLERMSIVQSRGLRNNATEHHDKIVSIVKRNISKIKNLYKKAV